MKTKIAFVLPIFFSICLFALVRKLVGAQSTSKRSILIYSGDTIDAQNDAGSRTVVDVIQQFKMRNWHVLHCENVSLAISDIARFKYYKNQVNSVFIKSPVGFIKYILLSMLTGTVSTKIYYYPGDIYFNRSRSNLAVRFSKKDLVDYLFYRTFEKLLWRTADVVLSPGREEANYISKFISNRSVVMPVTFVSEKMLEKKKKKFTGIVELLFVGGSGHTPNKLAVEYIQNELIQTLNSACPVPFRVTIVGSGWKELKLNEDEKLVVAGRISDDQLRLLYKKCDLAIVPLLSGAGVKGKVVEAFINARPVLTTKFGAQGLDENFLCMCDTSDDFGLHIKQYVDDPTTFHRKVDLGQSYIAQHFDPKIFDLLFSET